MPGVLGSRSTDVALILGPSLAVAAKVTGVLNGVVVRSSSAAKRMGAVPLMLKLLPSGFWKMPPGLSPSLPPLLLAL